MYYFTIDYHKGHLKMYHEPVVQFSQRFHSLIEVANMHGLLLACLRTEDGLLPSLSVPFYSDVHRVYLSIPLWIHVQLLSVVSLVTFACSFGEVYYQEDFVAHPWLTRQHHLQCYSKI